MVDVESMLLSRGVIEPTDSPCCRGLSLSEWLVIWSGDMLAELAMLLLSLAGCCTVVDCCVVVCRGFSVLSCCDAADLGGMPRAVARACERSEGAADGR